MTADPAHLDELERKGDSLLDEESFQSEQQPWSVEVGIAGTVWVRLGQLDHVGFTVNGALRLANAILSEIEIAQREGRGEW